MLVAEGRAEEAVSAYRAALARSPDHPEALVGLGNLALSSGDVGLGLAPHVRAEESTR